MHLTGTRIQQLISRQNMCIFFFFFSFLFNCLSPSLMWRDRQKASQTLWHLAKLQ